MLINEYRIHNSFVSSYIMYKLICIAYEFVFKKNIQMHRFKIGSKSYKYMFLIETYFLLYNIVYRNVNLNKAQCENVFYIISKCTKGGVWCYAIHLCYCGCANSLYRKKTRNAPSIYAQNVVRF